LELREFAKEIKTKVDRKTLTPTNMKKPFIKSKANKVENLKKAFRILNGCGGNKGTKCGVEVYYMPADSKLQEINA
jgi:hypothetical protein